MVPTVALPPVIPSTAHTTAWLVVLTTVAVNCCDSVKVSGARGGCTVTPTAARALDCAQSWIARRKKTIRQEFIWTPDSGERVLVIWKTVCQVRMAQLLPIHTIFKMFVGAGRLLGVQDFSREVF